MSNNTSYVMGSTGRYGGDCVYLVSEDSRALGNGSKLGENVYRTRWPHSRDNPNPRYEEACALVRGRYDRDARPGTQLLLRERGGSRRSLLDIAGVYDNYGTLISNPVY